ncbi:unnamed protein product [Hymenolepis diminuta]|nr:unnamed protein product [Hymenolepis diminuta]
MWRTKLSYERVFEEVSRIREIWPNIGFELQLKYFERRHFTFDTTSRAYRLLLVRLRLLSMTNRALRFLLSF